MEAQHLTTAVIGVMLIRTVNEHHIKADGNKFVIKRN